MIRRTKKALLPLADVVAAPVAAACGKFLKKFRYRLHKMPRTRRALYRVGVFPLTDHYYEPLFNTDGFADRLPHVRNLPGVDLNVAGQLQFLKRFTFQEELLKFPLRPSQGNGFYYHNEMFDPGDSEFFYSLIRTLKPKNIIEIGSGQSTRMARCALQKNAEDDPGYECEHICIEPYECEWLNDVAGITVVRKRVEEVPLEFFSGLGPNDILFIDSSHVIRPYGDVLYEYLEILPNLRPGVIVHVHDIFTPREYPKRFLIDEHRFWNEQYLLEAFLACNSEFEVIGALNYLKHNHPDLLASKCPVLASEMDRQEPASFWMMRRNGAG